MIAEPNAQSEYSLRQYDIKPGYASLYQGWKPSNLTTKYHETCFNQEEDEYQYPNTYKFFKFDNKYQPILMESEQSNSPNKNIRTNFQFLNNIENREKTSAQYDTCFDQFNFDSFNLKKHKPSKMVQSEVEYKAQPFMGAFFVIQHQFDNFDIKLKVPSYKVAPAFTNFISYLNEQQDKLTLYDKDIQSASSVSFQTSNYDAVIQLKNIGQGISRIAPAQEHILAQSMFCNFQALLTQPQSQNIYHNLWQQNNRSLAWSRCFQFQKSNNPKILHQFQQKLDIISQEVKVVENKRLLVEVAKMLQGIQSEFCSLDYNRLQWTIETLAFRLQHSLRNSLHDTLDRIIVIANCKSRLQCAAQYIQKNKLRRLYIQFSVQISKFLNIFEQIVLEKIENESQLIEFISQIEQCETQIKLIYGILIDQKIFKQEKRSFFDFNHQFLNAEYVIFSKVLKLSKIEDSFNQLQNNSFSNILSNILVSIFRPIAFSLSEIIFEQNFDIKNKDQHYLQFYMQNAKNLSILIGRKIKIIKQESNELYLICKKKLDMKIVKNIDQLKQYELQWNRLFYEKRKSINQIKQKERLERKFKKQKESEKRVKQIYELKKKMLESVDLQNKLKSAKALKAFEEARKLKQQIQMREQQRRLVSLIEKQRQKGYLLEQEYKQKQNLQKAKLSLLQQAQKLQIKIEISTKQYEQVTNLNKQQVYSSINSKTQKEPQERRIDNIIQDVSLTRQQRVQSQDMDVKSPLIQHRNSNALNVQSERDSQQMRRSHRSNRSIKHRHIKIKRQNSNSSQQSDSESISGQSEQSQKSDNFIEEEVQEFCNEDQESENVNTVTVLEICIDKVIEQQIQITHMAMGYLIYEKYQLFNVLDYMKKVFMAGKGDLIQDFLNISVNNIDSVINLKYFKECLIFDEAQQTISEFNPQFYCMRSNQTAFNTIDAINFAGEIRLFSDQLEYYIGFEFKNLPATLQPYFSYIHLGKYMEIFSFILRLRHCSNLISDAWKQLNIYKHEVFQNKIANEVRILNKLFATRYIVQSFLNILQNYLYFRVIEKEEKNLRSKLNEYQINELSMLHQKMLDNIIRNGFISNPHNDVSKKMKEIFGRIRDFKSMVDMFCVNDVPSYMRQQIQAKVDHMTNIFKKNQQWFQNLFFFS